MTERYDEKVNVFVYGSLKRGEALYFFEPLMRLRLGVQPARLRDGALYDLGPYPGVVLQAGVGTVLGEIHRFRNLQRTLKILDLLEGYHGEGHPENLYRRVQVKAELVSGEEIPCWLYEYVGPLGSDPQRLHEGIWEGQGAEL